MKNIFIVILLLVVYSCSNDKEPKPINIDSLNGTMWILEYWEEYENEMLIYFYEETYMILINPHSNSPSRFYGSYTFLNPYVELNFYDGYKSPIGKINKSIFDENKLTIQTAQSEYLFHYKEGELEPLEIDSLNGTIWELGDWDKNHSAIEIFFYEETYEMRCYAHSPYADKLYGDYIFLYPYVELNFHKPYTSPIGQINESIIDGYKLIMKTDTYESIFYRRR